MVILKKNTSMCTVWKHIIAVLSFVCATEAGKLPSYITQCNKSDPNLDECVLQAANQAIPVLVKGDYHYDIPKMNPLRMENAVIKYDRDLKFILYDLQINGIETANVSHAKTDFEAGVVEYSFTIPSLNILANRYELSGTLFNVSLYGQGSANITLVDGEYNYSPMLKTRSLGIVKNYEVETASLKYTTNRTIYQLDNLYTDDLISYDFNDILNKNWEKTAEVFRPPAEKIIGDFVSLIYNNLAKIVSTDEFFKSD